MRKTITVCDAKGCGKEMEGECISFKGKIFSGSPENTYERNYWSNRIDGNPTVKHYCSTECLAKDIDKIIKEGVLKDMEKKATETNDGSPMRHAYGRRRY